MSSPEPKPIRLLLLLLTGVIIAVYLLYRMAAPKPVPPSDTVPGKELQAVVPATAEVFEKVEFEIRFPPELAAVRSLPETQLHDAYDADRNGVFVDLAATFAGPGERLMTVPAFAVRDRAGGKWQWRVRWAPPAAGEWSVQLRYRGRSAWDQELVELETLLAKRISVRLNANRQGPLIMPGPNDNPSYLRVQQADGSSRAVWQFGACRAWVVDPGNQHAAWAPDEWIDRRAELLPNLQAGGFNLLNQWMAPWEYLLVHHDRAEHWRQSDGSWQRRPLPNKTEWSAYQYYDQGRAAAFDRLLDMFEENFDQHPVRLLLSPLPHQCFQLREHPWGGQESGFSPQDDRGRQSYDRLNGFSAFRSGMSVWDFFAATPEVPLNDWRGRLFDHQANFMRYLIARWGYSPALGLWVLIDELDGVGDTIGSMTDGSGWWAHPQCDRWLALMVKLFKGRLRRSDGMTYLGDPFAHPLHAATTSAGGQIAPDGNLSWQGGTAGRDLDVLGWHWYPDWEPVADDYLAQWELLIQGVQNYAAVSGEPRPRLISEFGAVERYAPVEAPNHLYPTLFHHAVWAGIFSGLAGTPMDWDDGKEFGELRWRSRSGAFAEHRYPIDHVAQMRALRRFLAGHSPETLQAPGDHDQDLRLDSGAGVQGLMLQNRDHSLVLGWFFAKSVETATLQLRGLRPGNYQLQWYDPWTGRAVTDRAPARFVVKGRQDPVDILAVTVLRQLRQEAREEVEAAAAAKPWPTVIPPEAFPSHTRKYRGHDAAFKIRRVKKGP